MTLNNNPMHISLTSPYSPCQPTESNRADLKHASSATKASIQLQTITKHLPIRSTSQFPIVLLLHQILLRPCQCIHRLTIIITIRSFVIINASIGEDLAPPDAWISVRRRSPRKYARKNETSSMLYVTFTRKVCVQFANRLRIMFINRMNYFARTLLCSQIFGEFRCEYDNTSKGYYFCSRFVCE